MPTRKATPKPVYRIRNWKQYNDALVRRGSIILWVDQATLEAWLYQGPTQRGAQRPGSGGRSPPYQNFEPTIDQRKLIRRSCAINIPRRGG
ncbi:hypothetical protein P12x_005713 [Tundrisphaera lichenicola]|uniref:hypothetical protein n=1 Tax=Tundrisphaera lichenicola TaxID=2029860 RepID=UPI003EBF7A47